MTVANPAKPLSIKVTGLSLSAFLLLTFLLCVIFGLLMPSHLHMHEAWAPLLPGFEWLTLSGFIFGAVGAYLYGWFIAIVFVPIWRFFERRS
jgi:hypothetical protein